MKTTLAIILTVLTVAAEFTESKSLILSLVIGRKCSREGLMCKDCKTLVRCTANGESFTEVVEEICQDNIICNEATLTCDRTGDCRSILSTGQPTKGSSSEEEMILAVEASNSAEETSTMADQATTSAGQTAPSTEKSTTTTEQGTTSTGKTPPSTEKTTTTTEPTSTSTVVSSSSTESISSLTQSNSTRTVESKAVNFTCKYEGVFEDSANCTQFYECYRSGQDLVAKHLTCRKGSHFDRGSMRCVRGECQNTTSPPILTCKSEGYFEDPSNCTMYYRCTFNGTDYVKQELSCRKGSYFSASLGRCVKGSCSSTKTTNPLTADASTLSDSVKIASRRPFSIAKMWDDLRTAFAAVASYPTIR